MGPLIKIVSIFLTCMLGLKIGFPTAFLVFEHDPIRVMSLTIAGGIVGNVFFTHLSAALLKALHRYRVRRHLIHRRKIFTKLNRRVIRIKQRFGLTGIAFITPLFLSTPFGAFVAERFFRDKRKIIIYLSISTILWAFAYYFVLLFFYDNVKGWLL